MIASAFFQSVNKTTFILVVLLLMLGLQLFQIWSGQAKVAAPMSAVPLASTTPVEIFSSQTATIRGKITKINGQLLTIQNDQNTTGEFAAGRVVLINDSTNLQVASNSSELQKIPLNKELLINLLYVDGKYVVTSLTAR